MKLRRIKNLLMVGALAPALGAAALVGCGDSDDDMTGGVGGGGSGGVSNGGTGGVANNGGSTPIGGTGGGGAGGGGGVPKCTTENTPVTANVAASTTWDCPSYLL